MRPAALASLAALAAAVALAGCSGPGPTVHLQVTGHGTADLSNLTVSLDQVRIQHVDGDPNPTIGEMRAMQDVDLGTANATAWGDAAFPGDAGDLWIVVHAAGDAANGSPVVWTQQIHVGPVDLAANPSPTFDVTLTAVRHGPFEPTYTLTADVRPA